MMRLKNLLSVLLISPEILIVIAVFVLLSFFPEKFQSLGESIRSDAEIWKYLPGLTIVFASTAFNYSSKIRAPLEGTSNKSLYEWPHYDLLVHRVYVSLLFAVLAGVVGLWLWFFGQSLTASTVGAVFLASTLASGTTALTMLLAHQKLRELVDRHS
jgi:hypothetical protein